MPSNRQYFQGSSSVEGENDLLFLEPIRSSIIALSGGGGSLASEYPKLIRSAIDYVVDPIRTGRTSISDLDSVEKTFLGLKVEHFIRDFLDVPKGIRDLRIDGKDVDVKNTIGTNWMIPQETYSESGVCLLSRIDDRSSKCWLGVFVARSDYLGAVNRDQKRSLNEKGRARIVWLLESVEYSPSPWEGLDMARFRELRMVPGGTIRAAAFFEENIGRSISREVVQSLLHDQKDYMKRLRGNGGARDVLAAKGITLNVDSSGACLALRS